MALFRASWFREGRQREPGRGRRKVLLSVSLTVPSVTLQQFLGLAVAVSFQFPPHSSNWPPGTPRSTSACLAAILRDLGSSSAGLHSEPPVGLTTLPFIPSPGGHGSSLKLPPLCCPRVPFCHQPSNTCLTNPHIQFSLLKGLAWFLPS